MLLKNKKYTLLGMFLFFLVVINQGTVMSKSAQDRSSLDVAQIVIREMLSSLPSSIEQICVLEVSFNGKSQLTEPIDLKYLDNRIVTNPSICSDHSDDPSKISIMYMNDARTKIRQMEKPSGQKGDIYDRVLKYINTGHFAAFAAIAECGADIHIYILKNSKDGFHLIDSVVIGTATCAEK